jgi:hypothetical protein
MNFAVTFQNHPKLILATMTFKGDKVQLKREKQSQGFGYHIPASNDASLKACAEYLTKETAAISAVCCGYLVTKSA